MTDWNKIKNYYILNSASLKKTAEKFNVSVSSVEKHAKQQNWAELKEKKHREVSKKIEKKTTDNFVDKQIAANEKHNELFAKGLEIAQILLQQYLDEIANNGLKKIKPVDIDIILSAISKAQKGQRLALNIANTNTNTNTDPEIKIIKGVDLDKI